MESNESQVIAASQTQTQSFNEEPEMPQTVDLISSSSPSPSPSPPPPTEDTTPSTSRPTPKPDANPSPSNARNKASHRVRRTRTKWTTQMDTALLQALIELRNEGKYSTDQEKVKSGEWRKITRAVNAEAPKPITWNACCHRWQRLRSKWRLWRWHKKQVADSWTWDDEQDTYVSDESVMDAYFDVHSDLAQFRHRGLRFRDMFGELLDDEFTPGAYGMGIRDVLKSLTQSKMPAPSSELVPIEKRPAKSLSRQQRIRLREQRESGQQESGQQEGGQQEGGQQEDGQQEDGQQEDGQQEDGQQEGGHANNADDNGEEFNESLLDTSARALSQATIDMTERETKKRAINSFLGELNNILPEDAEVNGGEITFATYFPMLSIFREDYQQSLTYLRLRERSLEDTREWVASVLDNI